MTPLPFVPNTLKIQIVWYLGADLNAMTVLHASYGGGPPTSANCASMAANITASAGSAFAALLAADNAVNGAVVTDISSATGGQGEGGTQVIGTRSGGFLPPAACAVVNHTIARRYRGGKPRAYLPLGTSTDIDSAGQWTTAFQTAVLAAWNSFSSAITGDGAGCTITGLVNVSYYEGSEVVISPTTGRARNVPQRRATPLVNPYTSSFVDILVGSQRRRNRNA